eukprot:gene8557-biopygen10659
MAVILPYSDVNAPAPLALSHRVRWARFLSLNTMFHHTVLRHEAVVPFLNTCARTGAVSKHTVPPPVPLYRLRDEGAVPCTNVRDRCEAGWVYVEDTPGERGKATGISFVHWHVPFVPMAPHEFPVNAHVVQTR